MGEEQLQRLEGRIEQGEIRRYADPRSCVAGLLLRARLRRKEAFTRRFADLRSETAEQRKRRVFDWRDAAP